MHPISDKELDKLFQQRFAEAEFKPSAEVWEKIAVKMDQKEKVRRSFPVFWMAAASVLVIIGTTLWFYRDPEVIMLQGSTKQLAQNAPETAVTDLATGEPVMDHVHADIKGFDFSTLAAAEDETPQAPAEVTLPENKSGELSKAELTASNNVPRKNTQDQVASRKEVTVPRYSGDQSQLDVTQPDMIASTEVGRDELIADSEAETPRKIRSVGGLVNFVISKVDRREDKIIEFKDGEEGSEVSGINLGLIKLKSKIK